MNILYHIYLIKNVIYHLRGKQKISIFLKNKNVKLTLKSK